MRGKWRFFVTLFLYKKGNVNEKGGIGGRSCKVFEYYEELFFSISGFLNIIIYISAILRQSQRVVSTTTVHRLRGTWQDSSIKL